MPAGRPTKYGPAIIKKARDYLENWEGTGDVVPSQVGLAIHCGIALSTAKVWAGDADKEKFSAIFGAIGDAQHRKLINGSLIGILNSTIAKVILTKHGYSDKKEITGADGGPIETKKIPVSLEEIEAEMKERGIPFPN